ncbi:DUF4367 domain-containing protein [Bacillaceae bacterium W0354]
MEDDFLDFEESMSIEEIQEQVDFTIPQVTSIPADYKLVEGFYDESIGIGIVMLNYEKDDENGFMLSIYPSREDYGEELLGETSETITIKGNEGTLTDLEDFLILTWEQDGLFLELIGGGPDMNKDLLIEIAESVQ